MPTSQKMIESNRRNAQKSTGPRTYTGKNISKYNRLRHGLTAATVVIPTEERAAFDERMGDVAETVACRSVLEELLVSQLVHASWVHDRSVKIQTARLSASIEGASAREFEEVCTLGQRLFHDPRVPNEISGAIPWDHVGSRTSHTGAACNPNDPAMIVRILSSTVVGCQWLLDNWAELKELLDDGGVWQGNHKFKAARLMGKQPADCLNSRKIATLYVASWSLNSLRGHAYSEQRSDFGRREYRHYIRRVRATWPDMINAIDHVNARRVLVRIVEKEVEAVQAKLALARERAASDEARRADCLSFDDTHTGELLRRYETASHKKFVRSLHELFKLRRAAEAAGCEELFDPGARRRSPEAENRDPDNSDNPQNGNGPQTTDNSCNPQRDHWQPATDDSSRAPCFLPTEAIEDCAAAPNNPSGKSSGADRDNLAPTGPGCEPNLRHAVSSQCEPSDRTVTGAQTAPDRPAVAGADDNPTTWRLPTAMHLLLLIVLMVQALTLLAASDHDVAGRVDDVPTFLLAPPGGLNSPSYSTPADARGNDAPSPDHSPREFPAENPAERGGALLDQSLGIVQEPMKVLEGHIALVASRRRCSGTARISISVAG